MTKTVQAVYENGLLRPLEPLSLLENEQVSVTIAADANGKNSTPPALSQEEFDRLLDELASGPALPHLPSNYSRDDIYVDHD
jgi:predicted DNA-binding antitoxin AbrB/MazE fold protein